jgi:hypothetical protein
MDALIQKLIALVNSANGSLLWDDMLEALNFEERSLVVRAVAQARSDGRLKRRVRFDREQRKNILTLEIPAESDGS